MLEAVYQGKSLAFWVEMLRDQDQRRRQQAAGILAGAGLPAVPGLIRLFKEGHRNDRYWAIRTLGIMGPPAKPGVSVIRLALEDQNPDIREAAIKALERIDPDEAARRKGIWHRLRRWFQKKPAAVARVRLR